MSNKSIESLMNEYEKLAYSLDCQEGLTGYRSLSEKDRKKILEKPTDEAKNEIENLIKEITS